ncbi:hypothetical protein [Psychrobacillus sp. FSL H8-0510]|uniref:hypothetical protein n=1 Tax=Psychrobacillus sp. FSL H8-0510 TaxID=2921394 RepID=UPI0030F97C69
MNVNINQKRKQLFCNEVALPNNFNIAELYNSNREKAFMYEMFFLDECFVRGFFDIHKFEINTVLPSESEQRRPSWEVMRLKEYSREKNLIVGTLWNLIQEIRQYGFDVLQDGDSVPWYVRAYVPAWKLMVSPSTQSIRGILHMLNQPDGEICIVTCEGYYENDEKPIAYFIESKPQFHKAYKDFLKEKEIEMKKHSSSWIL